MALKNSSDAIHQFLNDERIRTAQINGEPHYCAADLIAVLTGLSDPGAEWAELRAVEPALRLHAVRADFAGEVQDALALADVMRLIQVVDSPKAERLHGWMAKVAAQHLQQEADPELAIRELRHAYAAEGRTRAWIDQRLRSISARREVVSEWHRRGVRQSEQFRALTNALVAATFGMDVNSLLRSRGQTQRLRDHLTDLELALLSLAEATAASLHRHRNSLGLEQLLRDTEDAGRIVNETRRRIDAEESRVGVAA